MATYTEFAPRRFPLGTVVLAGLLGGLAEVLWVTSYAAFTPASSIDVAREITVTVFRTAFGGAFAPALGVAIHLLLSVGLAAAFTMLIWRHASRLGTAGIIAASLAALALVWSLNFLVVLPFVNPAFIGLLPMPVTLASKLLFGVAMGVGLSRARAA